jgi:hypothetical protein
VTFTAAALILSWIAIALLGFGYAGMRLQVRSLQAAMRLPAAARAGILESAKQLAPTTGNHRYVLTVDPGCVYCHEIVPRFRDLAARFGTVADFAILAADGEYEASPDIDVVVDATAYRELAPSWSPGLLVVGPGGVLLDVAPGGDLESLEKMLADTAGTTNSTTAHRATTEVTP